MFMSIIVVGVYMHAKICSATLIEYTVTGYGAFLQTQNLTIFSIVSLQQQLIV